MDLAGASESERLFATPIHNLRNQLQQTERNTYVDFSPFLRLLSQISTFLLFFFLIIKTRNSLVCFLFSSCNFTVYSTCMHVSIANDLVLIYHFQHGIHLANTTTNEAYRLNLLTRVSLALCFWTLCKKEPLSRKQRQWAKVSFAAWLCQSGLPKK